MKYKETEYFFSKEKITDVWFALGEAQVLCDNKATQIEIKEENKRGKFKRDFKSQNIIRCSLVRIEDILNYLDDFQLCENNYYGRNAFDFIEFINLEYVLVHCIIKLAEIFGTDCRSVKRENKCFGEFTCGNSTDYDIFEYIRSLCAVHPLETSMHPYVHGFENYHCCSKVKWDNGMIYGDDRDLSLIVYSGSNDEEILCIGLKVSYFVDYFNVWINFLDEIVKSINEYVDDMGEQFRTIHIKTPEEFSDYTEYIDNLRKEYEKRQGTDHLYLFDEYKLAFQLEFADDDIQNKKRCYQNAIKYMFSFLHKQLQDMNERENTGIVDLPENTYTALFYELFCPIERGSVFANERSAFTYIRNLNSSIKDDVMMAREVLNGLKTRINKFVPFKNNETAEQISLLFQIATYLEALELDGYISRSIPAELQYRGMVS